MIVKDINNRDLHIGDGTDSFDYYIQKMKKMVNGEIVEFLFKLNWLKNELKSEVKDTTSY